MSVRLHPPACGAHGIIVLSLYATIQQDDDTPPPRASDTCTLTIFVVLLFCLSYKSFPVVHVVAFCLTHLSPHNSPHRFLHLHFVRRFFVLCPTLRVHPLPLRKEGSALAAWPNSLLSQITSTSRSTCLQQDSLDTNLDDLATTVDGSEMLDTADVRRSISPLFSQEREAKQMLSIQCFKFLSGETHTDTDLFSSVGRPVRGVESFSNVEKHFRKVNVTENWSQRMELHHANQLSDQVQGRRIRHVEK